MDRRGMLKGLGVVGAAALWPGWLCEAFAGQPCGVMRGTATLTAALKRAHDGFKPLLVLVIPSDDEEKYGRGTHLGEWLNYGADEDLAALACAEVVCAGLDAVRQLFPSVPKAPVEPAVLLADADRTPTHLAVVLDALPDHPDQEEERDLDKVERLAVNVKRALRDEQADRCIARTGQAVRAAILGDPAALQRRASALWDALDDHGRDTVHRLLDGGDAPPAEVLRCAPALAAQNEGRLAAKVVPALAAAARAAYCRQRIPGSKWAVSGGCGEEIEGGDDEEQPMIDCGMGFVPLKSRRFLYFFHRASPL